MAQVNGHIEASGITNGDHSAYSVPEEAAKVFKNGILNDPLISIDLPPEVTECSTPITFSGSNEPTLPINWRFAESVSALKALEATLINVLLTRKDNLPPQEGNINTDHATLFIMSSLLWVVDPGEGGLNLPSSLFTDQKPLEKYFPSCDKHRMGASLHRNAVTNIYKCADGRYFHLHGGFNPDASLESVGLPPDRDAADYEDAVQPFIKAMSRIPSDKMQHLATDIYRQAGSICYAIDEFAASEHGRANAHVNLWEIHNRPNPNQPPSWWPSSPQTSPLRPLAGLKIVDLTRVIAAPAATRSLAELGASVMRCTSPNLPDYSALHIDLNWGKWNCSIDLKKEEDREKLWILILEADVVVQGYRPGVLDKYGFSQEAIIKRCENRNRGIISVRENCYGWNGPWFGRSGWQQISDAVKPLTPFSFFHSYPLTFFLLRTQACPFLSANLWASTNPLPPSSPTLTAAPAFRVLVLSSSLSCAAPKTAVPTPSI
jgi:hypothetical protein